MMTTIALQLLTQNESRNYFVKLPRLLPRSRCKASVDCVLGCCQFRVYIAPDLDSSAIVSCLFQPLFRPSAPCHKLVMASINLVTASASELQALLSSGGLTSVELVKQCLRQIEKHDRKDGSVELRAMMFTTRREKLFEIAVRLDEERASGKLRGPLHGLPVVLKDQWQVHPDYGMPTTAGMSALLEAKNSDSSVLVKKVCFRFKLQIYIC